MDQTLRPVHKATQIHSCTPFDMRCQALGCGAETTNPKFCSRSCAARHTNVSQPKRRKGGACRMCQAIIATRATYCTPCWSTRGVGSASELGARTIGEYRRKMSLRGRHPSWLHAYVRGLCRSWNRGMTKLPCRRCSYSLHVELAHVIALSETPDDTPLRVVNDPSNIIPLCKNCHWEFDNGHLTLDEILRPRKDSNPQLSG